ncbi:MAG: Uma2 family endonuclease [Chloroflexi bacterium]|nr:Uma2 family endonuclease [Chloroflexota bacterium]
MTTKPKPATDLTAIAPADGIVLRLEALGIDHRAADFPERFVTFCEQNDLYEMEVTAEGDLLILPMTGYRGNKQELYMSTFLTNWEMVNGGSASSQTVRFRLSSGAVLGPDAAWITQERFDELPNDERETIIEGAPDFVVEICSRTDNLRPLQNKMAQWMAGETRLGWLIDARLRQVHAYRAGQAEPQTLDDPEILDGEDVLPGFAFPVRRYIFDI